MTENEPKYRWRTMPPTPGGNEVEKVNGESGAIARRASDITDLGEKMTQAAVTLSRFADGSLGKGLSLDAIRDQAKEVHEDLATAGERYTPSGEALAKYAAALDTMQDATDSLVVNAESAWEVVNEKSWALLEAEQDQALFDRNPLTESAAGGDAEAERPDSSAEQAAFDTAVAEWEGYWRNYDAPFETWDDAYVVARDSLEEVNENGVEDGFWDNAMPFVEGLITALTWVGLGALLIALVFTGPIAAIAAAVMVVASLAVLALELSKFAADRGSGRDTALAVIGVVPFGKLTILGKIGSEFPEVFRALKSVDPAAQRMFGVTSRAWDTAHSLNTRNMLRTFAFIRETGLNGRKGVLDALCGLKPGEMPATLAEALSAHSQGVANLLVGVNAAMTVSGGAD